MIRRILRSLPLVALLACGRQGATPLAVTEFSLQQAADSIPLAHHVDVRVGDVWMTLSDVSSESRCPRGVTCIWAGDAVADIGVHPGCYKAGCAAPSVLLSLHAMLQPQSGDALGYRVQLLALVPGQVAGVAADPARYVAWVRVTK